ncbi:MAG TPA: AbrB/MazE/SpoVT family DNA-binding domain-containing protein [Thermoanaerobaculia bacterium]|jgi:bifunctional DNA-binding transcriptional regulator/antitoxin component of YhaV-PrlF toxin-antitoxin module
MPVHTVTQDWLESLPEEVRNHLHLQVGDRVEFVLEPRGRVEVRPVFRSFRSVLGMLHQPGMAPATIEEMDEAVGHYLAEDDERIQKGRQ